MKLRDKKNKVVIIAFALAVATGVFGFAENVLAACDYCSEPNCADYLVCEDWDIGTPPIPTWPGPTGQDNIPWHNWQPAGYGGTADNSIISHHSHSGSRCLDQYRAAGNKNCGDLSYTIAGHPTVVYIRFYLNVPESAGASLGDYRSHFLFLNTASSARVALDIAGRSREYCAGHCPYNPPYSNDDGKGENNSGYEWKDHIMLSPSTRPPTVSVVETEGIPFFFEDHFDEWVLVEWKVDFANKKTSLWINEIPYVVDYDMDWPYSYATDLIISGYSNYVASSIHYYIDDLVVSTSYIGPCAETGAPTRSNPQPNGTLASGTTQANISLTTNIQATCRYSNTSNTNYTDMPFNFTETNSTNHSTQVTGLENGKTYIYYVRCNSSSGYVNDDDFNITFSIDGHKADLNDNGVIDMHELMAFIARGNADDGVSRAEVEEARGIWFTGGVY